MKLNYKSLLLSMLFITFLSCDDTLSIDPDDASKRKLDKEVKVADAGLNEWTDGVPDPCKQVCLVAGQHMYVGTVDVAEVSDGLLVTYNVTEPGVYLEEIHLDIFKDEAAFKAAKKVSNGGAIPGKFEYKKSWSADAMITSHSVLIPTDYIGENIDVLKCIFIASHAALSNGETAWGGLCDSSSGDVTNLDDANQFDGANWSVYFQFCLEECVDIIDFTYAWEDLESVGNDGDYNDLVIQADIVKSADELKITFLASARGAGYDHQFKLKVPMTGVVDIFGTEAEDIFDDGTFYYITVFKSTKTELPAENVGGFGFAANTDPNDDTCGPMGTAAITLKIDGEFSYDPLKPYEPFITVYPSGTAGEGRSFDLYIWEVSNRPGQDIWTNDNGVTEFPNGIIIPRDWKWPYERQIITGPYPDFMPIATWNDNWADNLADSSLVFDCE